jgi:hypothetical protein
VIAFDVEMPTRANTSGLNKAYQQAFKLGW